ncbi:hypothetical protein KKD19_01195 [Patescibacteria group bacterium]|nr:hypothetical protein [Patescibacteria group bacterium]MBU4511848.1 hypothetical protein [Patescibacteria group bacterium]MCG2693474.1 hypothetical protein [Candidatus Parcubacteria bacterium]
MPANIDFLISGIKRLREEQKRLFEREVFLLEELFRHACFEKIEIEKELQISSVPAPEPPQELMMSRKER